MSGRPSISRVPRTGVRQPAAQPAWAALARELHSVRRQIERLAMTIVSDARFVRDYADDLQSFDFIIQHADECANLLDRIAQGHDMAEALAGVRLAEMQKRLHVDIEGA